jgi:cobalt-zinc-cadmium efflux system outer membrane protein
LADVKEQVAMKVRSSVGPVVVLGLALLAPTPARGQGAAAAPVQATPLSMADAVRLALERNQSLRAQRLTIDESKADEITAALKPNFNLSLGADGLSVFSPSQLNFGSFANDVTYSSSLGYTFERGGKRQNRISLARDTTDATAKGVLDAERQLRFNTEQAFISLLLAKSTLDLTRQDLGDFSNVVELNRQRVTSGDLSGADFLKISLQKLQFEQDVSAAEIALVQARASLRQFVGFDSVPEDFDVAGDLTHVKPALTLDDLRSAALASRADLQAADQGVIVARDAATLEVSNRARDIGGSLNYARTGDSNTMGVGVSFDLPFHNRNQGNILHTQIAVRQATETASAARITVLTDVTTAYAAFQTNDKVVALYESGYLDQAKESLDISTFAYQRGAASLLDFLDAERTYRDTQLAYRQALAALMTAVRQLNFAAGRQVVQ